jgi:streptomycin 3"-adenylyltransferase
MNAPRAQSVADADRDLRQYLIRVAGTLGELLGDALVALYVHGSLATGAFHRERSDVDLLAIVGRKLLPKEREAVARTLVRLSDARPMWGDIEVTVLQERYARAFEHPLPYEVQYSTARHEAIRRGRVDYSHDETSVDLAAQVLEARERGVTLVGPPPESMFGPVPWHAYINSLEADFEWAGSHMQDMPVYAVLNACRILSGTTGKAMSVLNKDEAGVWALENVAPAYHSVINDALQLYRGTKDRDDVVFDSDEIARFREYVRKRAQPAFVRASDTGEEDE